MPQSNLRSGVYRSFRMCDDPRGVVESSAIRKQKSRSNSTGGGRNEHSGKGKEPRPCKEKAEMPKKLSDEIGSDAQASLQLLRVSRRIQKLNEAIGSWSKGLSHEVRPDDIAKDLLRGALDLEESLAMLGRFQETSAENVMQKQRISSRGKEGRGGDVRFQRSMSDRFLERCREKVSEKPRSPDDVFSRDSYEELREVIRESFLRRNLLPGTTGAKNEECRSKFGASSSGEASTSSSQSSTVHGNDSGSTKSSLSSDFPPRSNAKRPSLIARLMGLDGFPKQANISVTRIDKPGIEQMKKMETPETEQRKGVLGSNSIKEIVLQSPEPYLVSSCCPEEPQPISSPSTIVLIKPLRVTQLETGGKVKSKTPVVPKKLKMQGEIHPRMISQRKNRATDSSITSNKMKLPLSLTTRDRDPKKMVGKTEEKEGMKTKQKASSNTKTLSTITAAPKPKVANKNVVKKKDEDGKDRRRSHDPVRKTPDNTAVPNKSNSSSETSTGRRSKLDSNSTGEQKKVRAKKVGEAKRLNAKKKPSKQDNAGKDLTSEKNSVSSHDTIGSVNQISAEEETASSEFRIQDNGDNREVSSCDASMQHSHDDKNLETSTDCKHNDTVIPLRSFLSGSLAFLSYAGEILDVDVNNTTGPAPTSSPNNNIKNNKNNHSIVISDQRLALDFAREVARRKRLQLWQPTCPRRLCISLDELLMEVCDGFEALRSYGNTFQGQNCLNDSVHMMLEKDLKGGKREMESGVWDLGWRSGYRIDNIHQVVIEVEKLILFGLIEETLSSW